MNMFNNNGILPVAVPTGSNDNMGGMGGFFALILLIWAMSAMGNGGFGFGNNNCQPDIATAGATTNMMQDNATRAQVAEINARQQFNQPFFGALTEGQVRTREDIARLDTHLCQLGNDRSQQINSLRYEMMDKFCNLGHEMLNSERRITDLIRENRVEDLKTQLAESKERYNSLQLACSQGAQTAQLDAKLDAIARSIPQPPQPAWPTFNPAGYGVGAGACNPCALTTLSQQIVNGFAVLNDSLGRIETSLTSQSGALVNLQNSVSRIPTTAAAA